MSQASGHATPRMRVELEDFRVDEVPAYAATGAGGHTFVRIEKRDATTEFAARLIARAAGVAPNEIGYAGRKDRRAVTTQWLSVPGFEPERALAFEHENLRVLEAVRHEHKLRTGHLRGNRFVIRLREVPVDTAAIARERAREVSAAGFANRFGAQRFGREGDNADQALAWLRGERGARPASKRHARFLLSALQAAVFNRVLADRPLRLDEVEMGDVAFKHESGGRFLVEDAERERERARAFEISATGPIFGTRVMQSAGEPARREAEAFEAFGLPLDGYANTSLPVRARGTRRPLRERAHALQVVDEAPGVLRLEFELPAGSYATSLVEQLVGEVEVAGAPSRGDDV